MPKLRTSHPRASACLLQRDDLLGPSLTPRQREVLEHLAEGLSNREIAGRLGISEATVRTHLRDVYGRLAVGSRTAAVARGRKLGMV